MPAFMTIGKLPDSEASIYSLVETLEDFKGDVSTGWHPDWILITAFGVDMKDEERESNWSVRQSPGKPAHARATQARGGSKAPDTGARTNKAGDAAKKPEEKRRKNTLTVSKPTDSVSMRILSWTKSQERHDIQIDCCTTEEDWPYMSLIFQGAFPTRTEIQEEPSDSIIFQWKRAIVLSYEFDSAGEYQVTDVAEFGELEESSGTTTAEQRGLANFVVQPPDPHEGAGRATASRPLGAALSGGLPPADAESQDYDLERRALAIDDVDDLKFDLESVRGTERLSEPFTYDLELRSETTDIKPKDLVGHEVRFRIEDDRDKDIDGVEPRPRHFSGIVASVLAGEMASDLRRRYHAVVVPTVWKLTQRSDCRVFQEKTVKDVVESVFGDAGFSDYDISGVTRQYPPMTCCIQYQETDFAFVSRLLEEAGIFYFFKHEEGSHKMMLCDGPTSYVSCPEDPLLFARDVHRDPRVTAWRAHYAFIPGKFDSRDYNFTTPKEPLSGKSSTQIDLPGIQDAEIFEYPGLYEDNEGGTTVADLRLQERETGHHFVHAVSCYDLLQPGMTVKVHKRPGEDPDGAQKDDLYLVTGVRFEVEQLPEYGMNMVGYRNSFTAIPEAVPFVPPRVTPRPRILGPHTAVVVGDKVSDEEVVDTDQYGRIKVQFHWDRHGKKDKDSCCWVRVAQATAGAGYGTMMIPRIGWEVVVSFLDGDPDRPLVTGCVYNELHMPPHELPGAKHKSVIMSRSFPNGAKDNFNELTFHDEKDSEEIYFHAERDFKRVVEHDDILEVGEKETGSQTITIEGDQTITLNQGDQVVDVAAGKIEVSAAKSVEHKVGGNAAKIDTSQIELKVGANSIKMTSSGIELKVGGSTVKLDSTGVTLKGMMVKIDASLQAEVKGMMPSVSGDGMLKTKGGITMMQ